jgi:hypothetical protein
MNGPTEVKIQVQGRKKICFLSLGYDFKNFVVKNKKNEETYNGANLE